MAAGTGNMKMKRIAMSKTFGTEESRVMPSIQLIDTTAVGTATSATHARNEKAQIR